MGLLSTSNAYEFNLKEFFTHLWNSTGLAAWDWGKIAMILIACVLLYLAIVKKFEPLLLLPIAFGMLLVNLLGDTGILSKPVYGENGEVVTSGGLFYYLYLGVQYVIYPPLIFFGIGAMTDFGPLIANPKYMIIGAGAQLGIFITFIGAILLGFTPAAAASIGIIGGADGPTAIYLTTRLGQTDLLPIIAIAAYSYMALIPSIQPWLMRALTTKKERMIKMQQLRPVSKREKILFPIVITVIVSLLLPTAIPLLGCLMLGNLFRECGVVERLSKTVQNELINIITIFLGLTVGGKATAAMFLQWDTIKIIVLGVIAFEIGTVGGLLTAKVMNKFSGGKINPLIGSAGVSAVPMAARVSQLEGQKEDPTNHLLMHAMGPNVAGVIGSAIAAGMLLAVFM